MIYNSKYTQSIESKLSRRFGYFYINNNIIIENTELFCSVVMKELVILDIISKYFDNKIGYFAWCKRFRLLTKYEKIPRYNLIFNKGKLIIIEL